MKSVTCSITFLELALSRILQKILVPSSSEGSVLILNSMSPESSSSSWSVIPILRVNEYALEAVNPSEPIEVYPADVSTWLFVLAAFSANLCNL